MWLASSLLHLPRLLYMYCAPVTPSASATAATCQADPPPRQPYTPSFSPTPHPPSRHEPSWRTSPSQGLGSSQGPQHLRPLLPTQTRRPRRSRPLSLSPPLLTKINLSIPPMQSRHQAIPLRKPSLLFAVTPSFYPTRMLPTCHCAARIKKPIGSSPLSKSQTPPPVSQANTKRLYPTSKQASMPWPWE